MSVINNSVVTHLHHTGYYGEQLRASIGFNPYEYWPLRLLFLLLGYATVCLPVYIVVRFVKKRYAGNEFHFRKTTFHRFLKQFCVGKPELRQSQLLESKDHGSNSGAKLVKDFSLAQRKEKFLHDCSLLLLYFLGIQVTLVCNGFFQERIITQGYARSSDPFIIDKFGDSQFLVLANRLVALTIAGIYLLYDWRKQPEHVPPLYVHSFISFSNTLSSWCQYEALKFVSFPTQTVCKAAKLIPTMVMGMVVRHQRYSCDEYGVAFMIAAGACIFFLSSQSPSSSKHSLVERTTTISGLILMAGYLIFDAFTPNLQKALLDTRPKISRYQLMLGVNVFSAILCFASLIEQGTFLPSLLFMFTHESFSRDVFLLSLCSAVGQIFIYATIEKFGPEVFAVIMTLRQIFSIVLSSLYFSHPITSTGIIGLVVVFTAIFYNSYRRYFTDKIRRYFSSSPLIVKYQDMSEFKRHCA